MWSPVRRIAEPLQVDVVHPRASLAAQMALQQTYRKSAGPSGEAVEAVTARHLAEAHAELERLRQSMHGG